MHHRRPRWPQADDPFTYFGWYLMRLGRHKKNWESLGRLDPFWAILSDPQQRHGRWDVDRFFEAGRAEIDAVLADVQSLGITLKMDRALDFGCGVGRLSRALAGRFERCDGVDISAEMVRQARELNADVPNVAFHVNSDSLDMFEDDTFDFIYTSIVLQHIPDRELIRRYLRDFIRLLRPGGVLVFQLPRYIAPRRRVQLRARLYSLLFSLGMPEQFLYRGLNLYPIRMTWVPEEEVLETFAALPADVRKIDTVRNQKAEFINAVYSIQKRG